MINSNLFDRWLDFRHEVSLFCNYCMLGINGILNYFSYESWQVLLTFHPVLLARITLMIHELIIKVSITLRNLHITKFSSNI